MLNEKQKRFVLEYLIDQNATQAAVRAGYSVPTAYSQGQRLLKHVEVAAAVRAGREETAQKLNITKERVLQEIARLAFYDPRKLFESDGSPKQVHQLDDDTASAVAGMDMVELFEGSGDQKHAYGLLKKVKMADKGQNLERLGRHLKLFTDKHEVVGEGGGALVFKIERMGGE